MSPDGKAIAFYTAQGRMIVCDLPACTSQRPLPPADGIRRRWTPDGRGLAYVDPTTLDNLWIQPLDGSAARQPTHFSDGRIIADYGWSYDGKRLAISRAEVKNDIVLFKGLK